MQAEKIIADVIVEMARKKLTIGYINHIAGRIYGRRLKGMDTSGITLQRTPLGFHSNEVAEFVGRLLTAGLVRQANPVVVTPEGLKWLRKLKSQK